MPAMKQIEWAGDRWHVLGEGARRDGVIHLHLASTTRGRQQRNGWHPVQSCDWVPIELLPAD